MGLTKRMKAYNQQKKEAVNYRAALRCCQTCQHGSTAIPIGSGPIVICHKLELQTHPLYVCDEWRDREECES